MIDRWNRKTVMIVADGLIALLSLWIALPVLDGGAFRSGTCTC